MIETKRSSRIGKLREYYLNNSPMSINKNLVCWKCHRSLMLYNEGWEAEILILPTQKECCRRVMLFRPISTSDWGRNPKGTHLSYVLISCHCRKDAWRYLWPYTRKLINTEQDRRQDTCLGLSGMHVGKTERWQKILHRPRTVEDRWRIDKEYNEEQRETFRLVLGDKREVWWIEVEIRKRCYLWCERFNNCPIQKKQSPNGTTMQVLLRIIVGNWSIVERHR